MRCVVYVTLLFSSFSLFFSLMFLLFFYETGNPCTKLHWEKIVIEILLELELIILLSSIFTESCWFLIPLSAYYCHTNLLSMADLIGTAGDSRGLSQPLLLAADSKSPLNLFQPINIWLSLFTEDQIFLATSTLILTEWIKLSLFYWQKDWLEANNMIMFWEYFSANPCQLSTVVFWVF